MTPNELEEAGVTKEFLDEALAQVSILQAGKPTKK
jgi:hypothetical protein